MGFFSDKCPECGAKVHKGASFCPLCGKAAPKAKSLCPACAKEVNATAKFCNHCGAPVSPSSDEAAPVDALNRWRRAADEFARRIEASDLRGTLHRGLVVEPGTQALVFQGGALAAVVTEGTYDLNRPLEGVDTATPATAILADAGEVTVPLLFSSLRAREDVAVDVTVQLVVRLADPAALHANLMHGRESLSITALADLVRSASANVVEASVKQASVTELEGNLQLRTTLESSLRDSISQALGRNGLELVDLRSVEFITKDYEEVRDRRAETFIAEQKADDAERRVVLNQRIRETLTKERMDTFTSAHDFEQFVRQTEHETGMKDVIRRAEMEELVRTYEEKKGDAEIARTHLLEKLELEHRLVVLRQEHAIDDERSEQARNQQRQRQEADWETAQHHVRIKKLEVDAELGSESARLQLTREKAELGMTIRKQRIAMDHEEETLRNLRELERKAEEIRLQEHVKDREAKRELEKIGALSEVEQARLATDLKKTEVMKDMSEEQILALMSKDSPHVAAAVAERAKAQAQAGVGAEVKALYEKILAGKEAEADRMERVTGKAMESMERVAGGTTAREREQKEEIKDVTSQSMDRMADVATAKAGAPGASGSKGSQEAAVVCPNCQRQVPAGSKFCDNCGHKFFE